MINNRYFIIPNEESLKSSILNIILGTYEEQRYSLDNTKLVIKLADNDLENYPILSNYTEYTHDEIIIELQKSEWN